MPTKYRAACTQADRFTTLSPGVREDALGGIRSTKPRSVFASETKQNACAVATDSIAARAPADRFAFGITRAREDAHLCFDYKLVSNPRASLRVKRSNLPVRWLRIASHCSRTGNSLRFRYHKSSRRRASLF